jgi:hypothetical protein
MKARLTSIDNRVALVHTDLVHLSDRMDRLENRMGRVETRLDLHEAEYMPKLVTVQQDIEQLRAAYQPEPCPFCASSEIEPTRSRSIRCGNCHVEVRPPAWHSVTQAEAMLFWNRCRRPASPQEAS